VAGAQRQPPARRGTRPRGDRHDRGEFGRAVGFRAGFTVSAALVAVTIVVAAALLRDEGRGQRVNMLELQAGQ
jgi:hypothetical protein